MILQNYEVEVPEGLERDGYVSLKHEQQYTIKLVNGDLIRCNAQVSIDGKDIGTFRLSPKETLILERGAEDRGRFTFYKKGTKAFKEVGGEDIPKDFQGALIVTFTPEKEPSFFSKPRNPVPYDDKRWPSPWDRRPVPYFPDVVYLSCSSSVIDGLCKSNMAPGVTGLSGRSAQDFVRAEKMALDAENQVQICLRLVGKRKRGSKEEVMNGPRKLNPISNMLPPPVGA